MLETYPRDDLFQISEDELLTTALEILNLQERRQLRLFARRDDYGRFVSCLIYVPRERYSTTVVERMEEILLAGFGGVTAEYDSSITASVLARLHVLVFLGEDAPADVDTARGGAAVAGGHRWWVDDLRDALGRQPTGRSRPGHVRPLRRRLPGCRTARRSRRWWRVTDLRPASTAWRPRPLVDRPVPAGRRDRRRRAAPQALLRARPISLSSVLPVLEQMGVQVVDERPYEIRPAATPRRRGSTTSAWSVPAGAVDRSANPG